MNKSIKIYIFILILIFVGIIWADASKEKPIDWSETFALNDKIPFGMYVFDKEHTGFFKPQIVKKFTNTPYEFLDENYNGMDSTYQIKGNVLLIDNNKELDENSENELLYFASHGNTIFYSAKNFSKTFRDSLGFEILYDFNLKNSVEVSTINQQKKEKFTLKKSYNNAYFSKIDSSKTQILGTQLDSKGNKVSNFIKIPYYDGFVILHLQPICFTNFNLLNENKKYTENILNFIPAENTIYWKTKSYESEYGSDSPLRYILSKPALKWAWYFGCISFIIFLLFNAKRKQRIIPITEPLKNTTLEFIKTIGNLYYLEKNHQDIAEKKIIFFLEKIRNEYYIDTFNLDATFINRLHQKTNASKKDIEETVNFIKKIRNQNQTTEKELITFNNLLEKLKL